MKVLNVQSNGFNLPTNKNYKNMLLKHSLEADPRGESCVLINTTITDTLYLIALIKSKEIDTIVGVLDHDAIKMLFKAYPELVILTPCNIQWMNNPEINELKFYEYVELYPVFIESYASLDVKIDYSKVSKSLADSGKSITKHIQRNVPAGSSITASSRHMRFG